MYDFFLSQISRKSRHKSENKVLGSFVERNWLDNLSNLLTPPEIFSIWFFFPFASKSAFSYFFSVYFVAYCFLELPDIAAQKGTKLFSKKPPNCIVWGRKNICELWRRILVRLLKQWSCLLKDIWGQKSFVFFPIRNFFSRWPKCQKTSLQILWKLFWKVQT